MKKQDLIDLGIAEDVAEKIFALHGKGLDPFKKQVGELQDQLKTATDQLTEANTTIEGFKKLKPEELQAAADDYKAKWEQAQTDAKTQLAALKFDHALESALTGAKAKNAKAVQALLQRDLLKLADDGSISGLKEQLEKIQADNDYLFESDKPAPKVVAGGNNQPIQTNDVMLNAARRAAGVVVKEG